jgi:autotransporter translocation and assembly factor TamB
MAGGYTLGSSRSFKKRAVIIPAVLVVLAVVGYGLRGPIQTAALKMVTGEVAKKLNAEIHYSRTQGNIFTGIALSEFSVRLASGDSLWTQRLQLRYNLFSLIQRRFFIPQIAFSAPELFIAQKRKPNAGPGPKSFFDFSITDLVVDNGRIHFGSTIIDSLSGSVGIRSRASTMNFTVRRLLFKFKALKFGPIASDVILKPGSVDLVHCSIKTGKSRLDLTARADFKGKYYELVIKEGALSFAELLPQKFAGEMIISGFFGTKGDSLFGAVSYRTGAWSLKTMALPALSGTVRGKGDSLELAVTGLDTVWGGVTADLRIDYKTKGYHGKFDFADFAIAPFLAGLGERLAPVKLNGDVAVAGQGFDTIQLEYALDRILVAGVDLGRLTGKAEKSGERLRIEKTAVTRGTMEVAIEGEVKKKSFRFAYALKAVPLELVGKIVKTDLKGMLDGKGEVFNNGISGWFRLRDGTWNRFSARLVEANLGFDDWKKLAGAADAKVQGFSYRGRTFGDGRLDLRERKFQGGFEAGNTNLGLEGGLSIFTDGFEVQVARLHLASNNESFENSKPFIFGKRGGAVYLKEGAFTFAGGQLIAGATVESGRRPRISLAITNFDLKRLGRMLNVKNPPEGNLTLAVAADTGYSARFNITRFRWADITLGEIAGRITGDEKSIVIEQLEILSETEAVRLAGSIGYSFESKTNQFKLKDMNLECTAHNAGAWLFSPLKNILELKQGRINGTVTLKGDLKNPDFGGTVQIDSGTIVIPAIKLQCTDAALTFSLKNNKVILTSGTTRVDKGTLLGTGMIEFGGFVPERIDFRFRGNDVTLKPKKEIFAVVSGELRLGWSLNGPLVLKGDVDIGQAGLTYQFGPAAGMGGGKPQKNPPQYDITIRGDKGIWFRNNFVNIELSVDLQMKSDGPAILFAGKLTSLRGAVYYLGQRLVITEGEISFVNVPELNPDLNIWAEFITGDKVVVSSTPEPLKIILHLSGTLAKPRFELTSEPPVLSETDIVAYLSLNRPLSDVMGNDFTDVMGEQLLNYFEQEVSKRVMPILHLDYLQISGNPFGSTGGIPLGSEPSRVTMGKYVSRNLYLTWTHNIIDVNQDVFQAQYSLGSHHELVGKKNEEGNFSFSYRFKFRY